METDEIADLVKPNKHKQYAQEDVSTRLAKTMDVDPLNIDHPVTLPFLDPYQAKFSQLAKVKPEQQATMPEQQQFATTNDLSASRLLNNEQHQNPASTLLRNETTGVSSPDASHINT